MVDEPTTVIISDKKAGAHAPGHGVDAGTLSFKAGDSSAPFEASHRRRSVAGLGSNGFVYLVPVSSCRRTRRRPACDDDDRTRSRHPAAVPFCWQRKPSHCCLGLGAYVFHGECGRYDLAPGRPSRAFVTLGGRDLCAPSVVHMACR